MKITHFFHTKIKSELVNKFYSRDQDDIWKGDAIKKEDGTLYSKYYSTNPSGYAFTIAYLIAFIFIMVIVKIIYVFRLLPGMCGLVAREKNLNSLAFPSYRGES